MPDAPPVLRRDIPPPGECVGPNESLVWHCSECEGTSLLLSLHCSHCGEGRPDELNPWVKLAERDYALVSPLGGGLDPLGPSHTPAFARFVRSMKLQFEHWEDGKGYDLAALHDISEAERHMIVRLLSSHEMTWREAEVLDRLDVAEAIEPLRQASRDHLSGSLRLEAAAALDKRGLARDPIDVTIAREIRLLDGAKEATTRAMRLAMEHPTDEVKQALLYASVCTTKSAPMAAGTLCMLCGKASGPDDPAITPILAQLGLHVNSFTRQAGFEALCKRVGMTLEV